MVPPRRERESAPLTRFSVPQPVMLRRELAKLSGKMLYTTASSAHSGTRAMSARWLKGNLKYSERSLLGSLKKTSPE